ncbi:unnamed protein product, partial [marine sediment metagenome]
GLNSPLAEGGQLKQVHVEPGDRVVKDQPLATLENIDLDLEIARLTGQRDQHRLQLDNLRRQRFRDRQAGAEIPRVREALETVEQQLAQQQADHARLRLVAPAAGMIFPPKEVPEREDPDGQLPSWSGTPLEEKNLHAYLPEGASFCQIGDPAKWNAVLIIDQTDRNYVKEGQKVEIKLDQLPHDVFHSGITEIAEIELRFAPEVLSTKAGGDLPTVTDPETGVERLQHTSYQAWAPIDDPDGLLRLGLRGRGKV